MGPTFTESLTFPATKNMKEALKLRLPKQGDMAKVMRFLAQEFLDNKIKVILPGTAEREI